MITVEMRAPVVLIPRYCAAKCARVPACAFTSSGRGDYKSSKVNHYAQ